MSKKRQSARALPVLLALGAVALGLVGAAQGSPRATPPWLAAATAAANKASSPPNPADITNLGPVKPPAKGSFYAITCGQTAQSCSVMVSAMKQAAKALGYSFQDCDTQNDPTRYQLCFTNALNAKPSVIFSAVEANYVRGDLVSAKKAHIPVIGMVTASGAAQGMTAAVNQHVCYNMGVALANYVVSSTQGKANALFLNTTGYACPNDRQNAFKHVFATCPTCKIKATFFKVTAIQTQLPQIVQAQLSGDSSLNYVIGAWDDPALIAVEQVRSAGLQNKVSVGGFDANSPNVALVAKGDIQKGTVAYPFAQTAYAAVDLALRIMDGQKHPNDVETPIKLIIKSNASANGALWQGTPNFQGLYEKLWGLK